MLAKITKNYFKLYYFFVDSKPTLWFSALLERLAPDLDIKHVLEAKG